MIKKEVISVDDLADFIGPFFEKKIGRKVGHYLLNLLRINKINNIHSTYFDLRGADFTTAALNHPDIDVSYKIHGSDKLEKMKAEGAFIVVANHPFGGLDGLMLIDIVGSIRSDFRVVANKFLTHIKALEESFIPVVPRQNKASYTHDPAKNINSLRLVSEHLSEGKPIGLFPAGGVANVKFGNAEGNEQTWQLSSIRIIKSAGVPVYPLYFDGENSFAYKLLNRISYNLTALKTPSELFNKRGEKIDVYLGDPIPADEISKFKSNKELRDFLMKKTLTLRKKYTKAALKQR